MFSAPSALNGFAPLSPTVLRPPLPPPSRWRAGERVTETLP
ncbi:MAG: hypothetical protein BIP78_0309 [Candidatus Bipolaricaulis sibiricus]|uniref:Uncharacterized protein n=1 Tax=Bipolaricaulis sibiricus TaxID=2501609 RepID=A0A410FSL0_BIPS1|nr:MAG: hypothetical protein BIP78_0309 [Candidatus Bipolaricaulis sibiricus]